MTAVRLHPGSPSRASQQDVTVDERAAAPAASARPCSGRSSDCGSASSNGASARWPCANGKTSTATVVKDGHGLDLADRGWQCLLRRDNVWSFRDDGLRASWTRALARPKLTPATPPPS